MESNTNYAKDQGKSTGPVEQNGSGRIEVIYIKPLDDTTGPLRGYAGVCLHGSKGSLTIHNLRIVQQEGKKAWVVLPQQQYQNKEDGKNKYTPIIEATEPLKGAISKAVLAAWEREGQR